MVVRTDFDTLANRVKNLKIKVPQKVKLTLYGLYKQVKEGPCPEELERPSVIKFEERAKYDSWKSFQGLSPDEAMKRYSDVAKELFKKV